MKAIILAAGSSSRMRPLTNDIPKALLTLGSDTLITRLRKQLASNGVTEIVVVVGYHADKMIQEIENNPIENTKTKIVVNSTYKTDTNIKSLYQALQIVEGGYYIFEADIIFEDDGVSFILSQEWGNKSVWFTVGAFIEPQYGGVLKADAKGNVVDIDIIPKFSEKYKSYNKLIGVSKVGEKEAPTYMKFVEKCVIEDKDSYYLKAWYENLEALPSIYVDIEKFLAISFNHPDEYKNAIAIFDESTSCDSNNNDISLVEVSKLRQIEGYSEDRVAWLKKKIESDMVWTEPLKLEKNHMLVLDGQHRMQVAFQLGLTHVPCMSYNYEDVDVWSLRDDEIVSRSIVIDRVSKGDLYPFKTVKHKFKTTGKCYFKLTELCK